MAPLQSMEAKRTPPLACDGTGDTSTFSSTNRARTRLELAILLAVLYADLFDFPLTLDELCYWLPVESDPEALHPPLSRLAGTYLTETGGFLTWKGREPIVALRHERERTSKQLWRQAQDSLGLLRRLPFLRMVAVCGSLAVNNAGAESDVDLFLVSSRGRLWLVLAASMLLRRVTALAAFLGLRRASVCPNFFLTEASLAVDEHNLYTAHEVAQVRPLAGHATYRSFVDANRWVGGFLPNARAQAREGKSPEGGEALGAPRMERLLGGRIGDLLDRAVRRVLLSYYRLRLRRRGVSAAELERSYTRERVRVVGGGYKGPVERRFRRLVAERLGEDAPAAWLDELFPAAHDEPGLPLYHQLLETNYRAHG